MENDKAIEHEITDCYPGRSNVGGHDLSAFVRTFLVDDIPFSTTQDRLTIGWSKCVHYSTEPEIREEDAKVYQLG